MKIKQYSKIILGLLLRSVFLKFQYLRAKGRWPDIKNPKTLTENIFTLKHNSDSTLSQYCDKLVVRDYVANVIKTESLDLLLPEVIFEIDYLKREALPHVHLEGFLKMNNGSGFTKFVAANSISEFSQKELKAINSWRNNYYHLTSGENCYADVIEKIYLEKALRTEENTLPDDIKVHCFNGVPNIYQIIRRTSGILERQSFNKKWEKKNIFQNEILDISLPKSLKDKITKASKGLSKKFNYVRVDFYLVDDDIYFGELTFFPASSHLPLASRDVDLQYGNEYLQTCNAQKIQKH